MYVVRSGASGYCFFFFFCLYKRCDHRRDESVSALALELKLIYFNSARLLAAFGWQCAFFGFLFIFKDSNFDWLLCNHLFEFGSWTELIIFFHTNPIAKFIFGAFDHCQMHHIRQLSWTVHDIAKMYWKWAAVRLKNLMIREARTHID